MNVQQKFTLLVLPKWKKVDTKGESPIYVRIKIDGAEEEISLGCKITEEGWDPDKMGKIQLPRSRDDQQENRPRPGGPGTAF